VVKRTNERAWTKRAERSWVEEDRRSLTRARREARRHRKTSPAHRQISDRLDDMTEAADLDNPQRLHGS
jgi:hypothetical protein